MNPNRFGFFYDQYISNSSSIMLAIINIVCTDGLMQTDNLLLEG